MALVVHNEIMKKREKHWITYIKQRISKNKNFIGFISGKTGSGKSWSSLSIGEQLDSEFNIKRVVFSGIELMDLINSGELKKGSAIVFEEAGVEMSNKNWQSVTNKMLNYLMQTFRHRNFILIMNSPYMDFVDASTRKLFHAEMRTMGINEKTKECKLKPNLIDYNPRTQKFYYPRLKVLTKDGSVPITFWNVYKPSDELLEAYEKKKREFTDALNKRIYDELNEANKKKVKNKDKPLTDNQEEIVDMIKKGMNVEQMALAKGVSGSSIKESMRLIKQKGYVFKPIRDPIHKIRVDRYEIQEPNNNTP